MTLAMSAMRLRGDDYNKWNIMTDMDEYCNDSNPRAGVELFAGMKSV
jgi:hypothetical protein